MMDSSEINSISEWLLGNAVLFIMDGLCRWSYAVQEAIN